MRKSKKLLSLLVGTAMSMMVMVGCSKEPTVMQDREGNEFTLPENIQSIVSTAPSNTEVLVELGLADKLVAIDKYSSDVEGISPELPQIDFRNPDAETLISLDPDIIIASGHNKSGDEDPFALLKEAGITVIYIPSSSSIDGIYEDIEFIAEVTGTEKKGDEIVDTMKKDVEAIRDIGSKIENKKKVYFEIGSGGGLYTFGNNTFMNEMLQVVGAENIFGKEESWITATPEAVIAANPDVILTNDPNTTAAGKTAIEDIKSRDGWDTITAIANGDVYEIDKNASSRGSHKIVKALKEIAKAIYPNEYKDIQE